MARGLILIVFLVLAAALVPMAASGGSMAIEGCQDDCASCHSLTKEEAIELLRGSAMVPADAQVKEITVMKSVGLWKVTLDVPGEKPLFIDFGKNNVFVGEFYPLNKPLVETSPADIINAE